MSLYRFILRDLYHYRKAFLAMLFGTILSTAVLTGALILGDSVRYSLKNLTEERLGKIRFVMRAEGRYFRAALADELGRKAGCIAAPVMLSEGIAINSENNNRINRVQVLGIDSRFTEFWEKQTSCPGSNNALISRSTAEKLGLKPGDSFLLRINRQGLAPANAPFAEEKSAMAALRFRVMAVAEDENMGRFSLNSNQSTPFNVFISLGKMQAMLDLKGKAGMLLLSVSNTHSLGQAGLDSLLHEIWQPEDAELNIHPLRGTEKYEITSGRIFIDKKTTEAIKNALPHPQKILTYLVNSISCKNHSTPYSFVTAASPDFLSLDPGRDGIIINSWLAKDLDAKPGDSISLRYFIMGKGRAMTEDSMVFVVKAIGQISDKLWDPTLMPDFPGISEAGNCRDWETSAPIDLKKIRKSDEDYWNKYRGTPKAFISFETGARLWKNPFGSITSLRFEKPEQGIQSLSGQVMQNLDPLSQGILFIPVYEQGIRAAANSTDFGGLFLSLGFFIILAALLLTALLFSLHIRTRARENGVLSAMGFSKKKIAGMLFAEGLIISIAGGILGSCAGILYNRLMLLGLNTIWQDAVGMSGLQMHVRLSTLITGAMAGALIATPVMGIVLLRAFRKPIRMQIQQTGPGGNAIERKKLRISMALSVVLLFSSALLIAFLLINSMYGSTSLFLMAGALMLASGSLAFYSILIKQTMTSASSQPVLGQISIKNAALALSRTMTVVVLLALGTFTVFITAANRRTFFGSSIEKSSGAGGYRLWGETSIPLRYDPSTARGLKEYALYDEPLMKRTRLLAMHKLEGEDASCLNLNQSARPAILGVPADIFNLDSSFSFQSLQKDFSGKPWTRLQKPLGVALIPGFADQTVITWGLQKKTGDTLFYTDAQGDSLGISLSGGLDNSVFQGYLLISDSLFRQHFPHVGGYKNFLVNCTEESADSVSAMLESAFSDYGMTVTSCSSRLASFNAVENTYLSVFMILGAMGVILGTLGLALVLLRNMLERKNEIRLYTALGFPRRKIFTLLFTEYVIILLTGMFLGMISAMAGILPSLLSPAFQVPWLFLTLSGSAFLVNGLFWVWIGSNATIRKIRS